MIATIWENMGFIRWPLSLCLVAVFALGAFGAARLFRSGAVADLRTKAWVDGLLFWGLFAVVTGLLGTVVGVTIVAQVVERVGEGMSVPLVWGGLKVALLSFTFGLLILALAGLSWYVLQLRWRFLRSDALEAGAV